MKCTYCGKETDVQYRLDNVTPLYQGVCRTCALHFGEANIVCEDCRQWLGHTAYEFLGRYFCEQCFLRKVKITKE